MSTRPMLIPFIIIALSATCVRAGADDAAWFCSVADPTTSKPQIVVYRIDNGNLIVNDWKNRLSGQELDSKSGQALQILENNAQGIIAVRAKPIEGSRGSISTRVVLIERSTGQVRDIAASITGPLDEIQGTCLPGN
jgi:hypothetical protein